MKKNFAKPDDIKSTFNDGSRNRSSKHRINFGRAAAFLITQYRMMDAIYHATAADHKTKAGMQLATQDGYKFAQTYTDEHIENILGWCFRWMLAADMLYSTLNALHDQTRLPRAELLSVLRGEYKTLRKTGVHYDVDGVDSGKYLEEKDFVAMDTLCENGLKAVDLIVKGLRKGHTYNALPAITMSLNHIDAMERHLRLVFDRCKSDSNRQQRLQKRLDRTVKKVQDNRLENMRYGDTVEEEAVRQRVKGRLGHRAAGDMVVR